MYGISEEAYAYWLNIDNKYDNYVSIIDKLQIKNFLILYNNDFVAKFFLENPEWNILFYFSVILSFGEQDNIVNGLLNNEFLAKQLIMNSNKLERKLINLTNDTRKRMLLLVNEYRLYENFNFPDGILDNMSFEEQNEILNESVNDEFICWLLRWVKTSVMCQFFTTDKRAEYLWRRFPITYFTSNKIKLMPDILNSTAFFEYIILNSIVNARYTINLISLNNPSFILERRFQNYLDCLIRTFDVESDLFDCYKNYLDFPKKADIEANMLFSYEVIEKINNSCSIDDLVSYLKQESNLKLSELIIDALFGDNIYNVLMNVKELLRANENFGLLSEEEISIYKMVVTIDNISSLDKLSFYFEYKDKNLGALLYFNIRKLKEVAYDNINNSLYELNDENKNEELSDKYGINIYDLRDKPYVMLIRCATDYKKLFTDKRSCYSLITSINNPVFYDSGMILGYSKFEKDSVIHMSSIDACTMCSKIDDFHTGTNMLNSILTISEINSSLVCNEIAFKNKKLNDNFYLVKEPSYLVYLCNENGECIPSKMDKKVSECIKYKLPLVLIKEEHEPIEFYENFISVMGYVDEEDLETRRLRRCSS